MSTDPNLLEIKLLIASRSKSLEPFNFIRCHAHIKVMDFYIISILLIFRMDNND